MKNTTAKSQFYEYIKLKNVWPFRVFGLGKLDNGWSDVLRFIVQFDFKHKILVKFPIFM